MLLLNDSNKINTSAAAAEANHFVNKKYAAAFVLLFGVFAFQLYFHIVRTSATVDEVPHILAGYRHLRCGDFGINPEHPPLFKMIAAAPLMILDLQESAPDCGSRMTSKYDSWVQGFSFLTDNDPDKIVVPVRIAAAFITLLFALLVVLAAREMFGRTISLLALFLLAFEPNLIAHGSLATTDTALSIGMFAAVYALYRFLNRPSFARFMPVAAAVGWTLTVKYSGLTILPILFVLLLADLFFSRRAEFQISFKHRFLRNAVVFAGLILAGYLSIWTVYGFRYSALPTADAQNLSIDESLNKLNFATHAGLTAGKTLNILSETHFLPEAYTLGIADVTATGNRQMFLYNQVYQTGRWFYFPAAFSIKSSLALLLLFPLGVLLLLVESEQRRKLFFLLFPPLFFFGVAMMSGMNIGIRHVLPIYGFFIVIAAYAAFEIGKKSKQARILLIGLLVFHLLTAYRVAPNYIAFANDLSGGTDNTYRLLSDSNVDWGQNLKLVNEYLAKENIKDCWFANFGSGKLAQTEQPCKLLPGGFAWNYTDQPVEAVPPVIEGTILISSGAFPPYRGDEYSAVTQQAEPVAQIGGTIFVYRGRFEIPEAALSSRIERCGQLARLNRFDEAVEEGRQAVKLSPKDARARLVLGIALSRNKNFAEARNEFEATLEILKLSTSPSEFYETRAREELAKLP